MLFLYWLAYPRIWLVCAGLFAIFGSAQVGLLGRDFIIYGYVFDMRPTALIDSVRIVQMRRFVKRQYRVRLWLIVSWIALGLFAMALFVLQVGAPS